MTAKEINKLIEAKPKGDGVPVGQPLGGVVPIPEGTHNCDGSVTPSSGIHLIGMGGATVMQARDNFAPIILKSRATNGFCAEAVIERMNIDGGNASCVTVDDTAKSIENLTIRDVDLSGKDTHVDLGSNTSIGVTINNVRASRVRKGALAGNVRQCSIRESKFLRETNTEGDGPILHIHGAATGLDIDDTEVEGTGVLVRVESPDPGFPAKLNISDSWIEPHGEGDEPAITATNATVHIDQVTSCNKRGVVLTDCLVTIDIKPGDDQKIILTRCTGTIAGVPISPREAQR